MSDKNIDKDKLEIIDLLGMVKIFGLQEDFSQGVKDMVAENVKIKSELETYKKIAEKLAEELSKHIWLNDKDAILKIYREKVEEDETYS